MAKRCSLAAEVETSPSSFASSEVPGGASWSRSPRRQSSAGALDPESIADEIVDRSVALQTKFANRLGWSVHRLGQLVKVVMHHEHVRGLGLDVVRLERCGGEVLDVLGDDHPGPRSDRGGEHVPVVRVGEVEAIDEALVAGGQAVSDCIAHQRAGPVKLLGLQVGSIIENGAHHLVEDVVGPSGPEESRLGQADQQITETGWVEDAGVVRCAERHRAAALSSRARGVAPRPSAGRRSLLASHRRCACT